MGNLRVLLDSADVPFLIAIPSSLTESSLLYRFSCGDLAVEAPYFSPLQIRLLQHTHSWADLQAHLVTAGDPIFAATFRPGKTHWEVHVTPWCSVHQLLIQF